VNPQCIGIVGLGLVGQALSARLRAAGLHTLGHDLAPGAMQAFADAGGEAVSSLSELAARVQTIVLAVFDTRGVLDVVEGEGGLMSGGSTVRLIVDCSTGEPQALARLSDRLALRAIDFVEAPLSGSSQQIAAGEAPALVGAHPDAFERAKPVLAALATRWIHVGAPGMGAKAKLATNLVLGLNRAVLAEGMVFAEALGIGPEQFVQLVMATPARSDAAAIKGPLMAAGDFQPRSRIRQHLKDVKLMLAEAQANDLTLPFSEVHERLLQEAVRHGHGDLDNAAIVLALRGNRHS
jgi:3-hydroxyisobutyrate dehydrogenase-like beta-hydroxyacid dehydrogenase